MTAFGQPSDLDFSAYLTEETSLPDRPLQPAGEPERFVVATSEPPTEEEVARTLARETGLEFVDLDDLPTDRTGADLLPESLARRYRLVAIGLRDGSPVVALANPSNVFALDDVRSLIGREMKTVISTPHKIDAYISRLYRRSEDADMAAKSAAMSATPPPSTTTSLPNLDLAIDDAPVVRFVNLILNQALNERASDIHIEPTANDFKIRFRIDGVLHHWSSSPKSIQGAVATRLKVMADLDIAEHRVPQDGRITLSIGKREIDIRLASLPAVHGEQIVLRLLDRANTSLELTSLGFSSDALDRYASAYRRPHGTILVTGPTGSGKSTTLYATLNELNSSERNLITVEDPVEYHLEGVNQVQVSPKAGLSFARALRSILRSDPDVILIGEIRDRETATIAIEAAMTGHLVLTCLHTNDAAGTPRRLIEMGVEPYLVGSALDCVLAQRLARVLCPRCSEPFVPSAIELRAADWTEADEAALERPNFRRAVGCPACGHTGYRGRLAIQEVMLLSEEIESAIFSHASTEEIERIAVQQGMCPLRRDGLRKAAAGLTSLEEIVRVVR